MTDVLTPITINTLILQRNFSSRNHPLTFDNELIKFCGKHNAKWFRYVDDVKVFTRSEEDARQAVFLINDALTDESVPVHGKWVDGWFTVYS
jgi:hypothetical protein